MTDDQHRRARNRFIAIQLVRIGATAVTLFGLLIWQTDMLRIGGSAGVGVPMVLAGLFGSLWVPQWLVAKWRTPPGS